MKVLRLTAPARTLLASTILALVAGFLAGPPAPATAASSARSPQLSVSDSSHWEKGPGTRYFVFTVRLTNPTGKKVTVAFATANGTAGSKDYRSWHGKLTFRGKTVTRKISVPVRGDARPEADETFLVKLGGAHGASLRDREGVGTIRNDDQSLTVLPAGQGAGTVTSSPSGIDCPTDCTQVWSRGNQVTLTATANAGSTFTGWSGDGCSGATPTCTVSVSSARSGQITATFGTSSAAMHKLTVLTGLGAGSGTVTSVPTGISCGLDCTEDYASGTAVVLTAAPATDSAFDGWSGGGCTDSLPTCVVTMDAAKSVVANFRLLTAATFTLGVTTTGTGTGTVASEPPGISCPGDCSEDYADGATVILTAVPDVGSAFDGWSGGGCSGTLTTCVVTMNAARAVTAGFRPLVATTFPLDVSLAGTGAGTVTSVQGINCPGDCTGTFADGTLVTLTAVPATGSTFTGWTGGCAGTTPTCVVPMTSARSVTAAFTLPAPVTYPLDVTASGTGTGTVTSVPTGVSCGADCTGTFADGTLVTLTAVPATGSTFTGWTGGCTGTTPTCVLTMDAAKTVSATFTQIPLIPAVTLTVTKSGTGTGTVTSVPTGISCGADCIESYTSGTTVILTAVPNGLSAVTWTGCDTVVALLSCTVTMTAARSVTAQFT